MHIRLYKIVAVLYYCIVWNTGYKAEKLKSLAHSRNEVPLNGTKVYVLLYGVCNNDI